MATKLFVVPYGKTGGDFVDELAALIQSFVDSACGSVKKVAWKTVTGMSSLAAKAKSYRIRYIAL